jgi:hypothetical protein
MNYARHEDKPFRMLAAFVAVMVGLILAGAAIPAHAQIYKVLYHVLENGPGPPWPGGPLAQGRDGDLYGYSYFGGTTNNGSIWKTTLPGDGADRQRADRSGDRQDHNQDQGRIVCK